MDLGLENVGYSKDLDGLDAEQLQCGLEMSPTFSPYYPPRFKPWKLNDNYNGLMGLESSKEIHEDQTSMLAQKFNWMSCDDEMIMLLLI